VTSLQTVHLRVNDAATGRPTPARIRLSDASGRSYAPLGRMSAIDPSGDPLTGGQVVLNGEPFAYIDGTCEVRLPPGSLRVQISKGLEYLPIDRTIDLTAGKLSLRLNLERLVDWRLEGWYAGDLRVHDLSPHAALLEGRAEGLGVVQLLARQTSRGISNMLAFSGNRECLHEEDSFVAVNTLNKHSFLGTVALLHSHRPVFPLLAGESGLEWSVLDWCEQCHRKTGLVVWPDLPRCRETALQGEALAAMLLGQIDALEVADLTSLEETLALHARLLQLGLTPSLVGASGKDSWTQALGSVRTYARLLPEQSLTADTWTEAVRQGRTFVTTGPLLSLAVAEQSPGGRLQVEAGTNLPIQATAQSIQPFDRLQLLVDGEVQAETSATGQPWSARLQQSLRIDRPTWIACRCVGTAFAQSNPVWVDVPGVARSVQAETTAFFRRILESTRQWVLGVDRPVEPRLVQHWLAVLHRAARVIEEGLRS